MAFERFLIAPFSTGLQTDLRPWIIPDDAFALLNNAYVFRGRVRKRFGSALMGLTQFQSRLRIKVGTTNGAGNLAGVVPGTIFAVGQAFSVGTNMFTVNLIGAPAAMLSTGPGTGTFNTTTGAFVIAGAPINTDVFWYPAQPVMGLTIYEVGPINNQPSYAFDTQFAYKFTPGVGWARSGTGVNPIFTGSNLNFFWTTNWEGPTLGQVALFVTNFNVADNMWFTADGTTWNKFIPVFLSDGSFVQTARIILPFKNRLVLLNTIETNVTAATTTNFVNRCRFSHNGVPFPADGVTGSAAWLEPNQTFVAVNADGAGFIDAATEEAIISAEFIKDRLIVFFERSTWELAYTGNDIQPFVWQKINTELGAESQNSAVPFDREILAIGNVGVHACNGANVERIDTKIPDQIFQIIDKNIGVQRVAGIRDYFVECVYWAFPSIINDIQDQKSPNFTYPNQVLLYNYRNATWAFNNDCITAFGYFQQQTDETWANNTDTWEEANYAWSSGIAQAQFRQIVAGDQEGFTFIVDPERSRNAPSMQLTDVAYLGSGIVQLTIIDHTLTNGDFIAIEGGGGSFAALNVIYQVVNRNPFNKDIVNILDPNGSITGTYVGGATIARVSNILINSKQWNPYDKEGQNVYLARIDFLVDKTSFGQITVDYSPSSANISLVQDGGPLGTDMLMGDNVLETSPYSSDLYPLEQFQERLWHPIYFQSTGECIQLMMSFSEDQMLNSAIVWEDFQMHALILHTARSSSRLQ